MIMRINVDVIADDLVDELLKEYDESISIDIISNESLKAIDHIKQMIKDKAIELLEKEDIELIM